MKNTQQKRKVIKESVWGSVIQLWNDTSQFGGAAGPGINMEVGQVFKAAVGTILGIGGLTVLNYSWDKIVGAIKSAPDKARKIIQAAKIIKDSMTADEAEGQLRQIGVSLQESKRGFKLAMIKSLVERIEKTTGKKVIFENKSSIEGEFTKVSTTNGKREIENWLSGMSKTGTGAKGKGDNTAEGLIKSLKASGFEIVKKNDVETIATPVNESVKKKNLRRESSR